MSRNSTASTDPAATPRKRSRAVKWTRRIVAAGLLVLVLAIGGGQVLLWTDLPRRVVVRQLQRQFGLRVEARSLSTGWFGASTLRDVTASLPLSDEAFLTMPVMRVSHTSLLGMIFGKPMSVQRIELRGPTLVIRQNEAGRWNLLEAAELVARAGGKRPATATASARSVPSIPRIAIDDGIVRIIDNDGTRAEVDGIDVSGMPEGPLLYRYNLTSAGERVAVNGQVVPGGFWQHEADLAVRDLDDLARPFLDAWQADTHVKAHWRGRTTPGGVRGRLELASLHTEQLDASGTVAAVLASGVLTAQPQRLLVRLPQPAAPDLLLRSGTLTFGSQTLRIDDLRVSAADGNAELHGWWDFAARSAELHASWREVALPAGARQSGSIDLTVQTAFPQSMQIAGTLTSSGHAPTNARWDAQLQLNGTGESFARIDWMARFDRAALDWRRDVDLSGLTLRGHTQRDLVALDDVSLPGRGSVTGRGELNPRTRHWWLWIGGDDVPLPRPTGESLAFNLNAWGTFGQVTFRENYLALGDVELSADGFFDADVPKPLAVNVWLTHLPALGSEGADAIRGRLRAEGQLVGTVAPLRLDLSGMLHGRDLYFRSRALGDPQAKVTGTIDIDEVRVRTDRMRLLGGDWEMRATWPSDPGRSLEVEAHVTQLPLNEVAGAFDFHRLSGHADVRASLTIPRVQREALLAAGTFELSNVNSDPFHADRVIGALTLRDGRLAIDVSEMREDAGRGSASLTSELRAPRTWNVRANLEDWPLEVPRPEASLLVSGSAELRADFAQRAAYGTAKAEVDLARAGADVGTVSLELAADGRTLHARRIDARALGGSLEGSGTLPIDRPLEAHAHLTWRDVEAAQLSTWIPRLEGFSGVYSGELRAGPTQDTRALGPLRIDLSLRAPNGAYRAMEMRQLDLSAFASAAARDHKAPQQSPERWRIVTRDAKVHVAEGRADVFARVSQRSDRTLSAQADVRFEGLNLDQLVHAGNPQADPMPGRLAGQLTLAGDPRSPRRVFGDADVELRESELANFDPIGFLYDLMRVGAPRGEGPSGSGRVRARLEAESLQVYSLYYFNRGVEIRGVGSLESVFAIPDSPIRGTLVGTARPLRDLRLPFMADVDEIFSVLQSNATTVEVSGTLREPRTRPTTLDQISETFRAMLLGDVQRENR